MVGGMTATMLIGLLCKGIGELGVTSGEPQ